MDNIFYEESTLFDFTGKYERENRNTPTLTFLYIHLEFSKA